MRKDVGREKMAKKTTADPYGMTNKKQATGITGDRH
jgi:hypothetical protein